MEYILFDLDGTLVDSDKGVINCILHACKHLNIEVKDRNELRVFLGPPLDFMFKKHFSLDDNTAQIAVKTYRERYSTLGVYENTLYDGIEECIIELYNRGKKLCLATSKPEKFARLILEQHGLTRYFTEICGASLDGKISTKDEVISELLKRLDNPPIDEMIMVGDRFYDVEGAAKFDIDCIGVLYGFGDKDELESAGAKYIAQNPFNILEYV